jgi:ElaB/YqjD/DUF883 family membrane-anchored ribosome-binding protein
MAIEQAECPETNPDPITGAPGAHPVGVGLGAAAGGIAAGAAAGTFAAGPIGTVVGAAIGAVVGGLAGKGAAESVNPTKDLPPQPESDLRLRTAGKMDDRTVEAVAGQRYSAASAMVDADRFMSGSLTGQSEDSQTPRANEGHLLPKSTEYRGSTGSVAGTGATTVGSFEDAYWRAKYRDEPYYSSSRSYDDYAPAYRLAHQRRTQYGGSYDASEGQLASEWERAKGVSRLTWHEAKQATRAAWNRLEGNSTGTDHLPPSHVGERHSPLNPPPLSHGAFQGLTRDALTSVADPVAMNAGHLSDAAHEAWEQTRDRARGRVGNYAATSDRKGSEVMHTVREAVRSRPLAAIGIGLVLGFLLVGAPSVSRAISRARWF